MSLSAFTFSFSVTVGPMNYHPPEDLLLEYAAGVSARSKALLIGAHLTYCPDCRRTVQLYEDVAASMVFDGGTLNAVPMAQGDAFALIDHGEHDHSTSTIDTACPVPRDPVLPSALREAVGCGIEDVPWQPIFPGIWDYPLPSVGRDRTSQDGEARLLKIGADRAIPSHTHRGLELTLVLSGSFHDIRGSYHRGDVCTADGSVNHRPIADPGRDCICLAVVDAPMRLTGPVGRILNLFARE